MSEQMYIEAFGDDDEITFQLKANPTGSPHEFHLSSTSGEVSLQATDRPDIQVWLEIEGSSSDDKIVTASWDGHRLDVAPAKTSGLGRVLRHHSGFDVRVEIPRSLLPRFGGPGIVARLHSASGELTVGKLAGDIRLGTASGGLSVAHLDGRLECQSVSGDVDLEHIRGLLKVSTVSGEVSLSDAILDRWEITTVSGGVTGEVVLSGTGPYRLNTVSGDTELLFGLLSGDRQPDAFTVESTSMSGDVEIEGMSRKLGRRRWQIGTGVNPAGTIKLTSVSGGASLTVESSTIDGDFRAAGGRWASQSWDAPTDPGPDSGSDFKTDLDDAQTSHTDLDVGSGIEESVNRAVGKVDWRGIDASVRDVLDTAFRAPRGRSGETRPTVAPTPPMAPEPPEPPETIKDDQSADPAVSLDTASPMTEEERRLDILRRIERGELSVEDGMAQLDSPMGSGQNRV